MNIKLTITYDGRELSKEIKDVAIEDIDISIDVLRDTAKATIGHLAITENRWEDLEAVNPSLKVLKDASFEKYETYKKLLRKMHVKE